MSTQFPSKPAIVRQWHVIDANDIVLGKLASKAAFLLMGKHKPTYTPFIDTGDHVIVVNAAKVKLTGRKDEQKVYRHFTGYPGGLVETGARKVRATRPQRMVEDAIFGMLPKTKMGKQMYRKLKVYANDKHPHQAQVPTALAVAEQQSERFELSVASKQVQYLGTGRRKTAIARVFLRPGSGNITVNGRTVENYFPSEAGRLPVRQALLATETADKFDMLILANGGGVAGQAEAIRMGVSRALIEFNAELRPQLKSLGYLTRDARSRERKKYGQKGARKRFQFSKR